MDTSAISIRRLQPADNAAMATIIRRTLEEFGANHPGTVYYDEETDRLSEVFETPGSWYFVATVNGEPVGGAGVFPTSGLPEGTVELVKMYVTTAVRGTGLGRRLLTMCMDKARELGYRRMYLETMPELTIAVPMYEKYGFRYLEGPMGNSGHFGCAIQMIRDL